MKKLTRPAMERIQVIHDYLQRKRFPNCPKLANALEVCERTILRDIEFMQTRFNLPVDYDNDRGGYHYTKPVEKLPMPTQAISETELFAILIAHKALAQYRGTPWHRPLQRAFKILSGHLDTKDLLHLQDLESALDIRLSGPDDLDEEVFDVLARAIRQRRILSFRYRKHAARTLEDRRVHPYLLACVSNRWYVIAYDPMRDGIRVFVVSRIREPEILKGTFVRSPGFSGEAYLRDSFGIFRGKDDFEVVIDLDAWAADVLRDRRWHASQQIQELPDGAMRASFHLDNLEEVEPWVMSWGIHATVVRPLELANRIARTAATLAERYGRPRDSTPKPGGPDLFPPKPWKTVEKEPFRGSN